MDNRTLDQENQAYRDTRGVSQNNWRSGFIPAFQDTETGRIRFSRYRNGEIAPLHIISWLPREWAERIDDQGEVTCLKAGIVTGFIRDGIFYTREEAANSGNASDA